jgi:hypothetical protein
VLRCSTVGWSIGSACLRIPCEVSAAHFMQTEGTFATVLCPLFLDCFTLKTEKELQFSKTSVTVYQWMWPNIPEDLIAHQKRCDNLISCSLSVYSVERRRGK